MAYCTIAEIRAEGFTAAQFDDARVQSMIDLATIIIDKITRRFFEPRDKVITVDGKGTPDLLLNDPIISITEVKIRSQNITGSDTIVDTDEFEVYNRHLTQNLQDPDDRDNPKLGLIRFTNDQLARTRFRAGLIFGAEFWPFGVQNVSIDGRFGYTEFDTSEPIDGITPPLIKRACLLITASNLETFAQSINNPTGNVVMEKVRDQTIRYSSTQQQGVFSGGLTGSSSGSLEADQILSMFMRFSDLGAA